MHFSPLNFACWIFCPTTLPTGTVTKGVCVLSMESVNVLNTLGALFYHEAVDVYRILEHGFHP